MERLSRKEFLAAFLAEWNARLQADPLRLHEAYANNRTWTDYVLSYGGFLNAVGERLKETLPDITYSKEIYSIDAMYVGGEDLFRSNMCYPSKIYALIEHENAFNLEEEMWKLIFWRSPLKVLICYDYNEYDKTSKAKSKWLDRKIKKLLSMQKKVGDFLPEPQNVEYIFLHGFREKPKGTIFWKWSSNKSLQPTALTRGG